MRKDLLEDELRTICLINTDFQTADLLKAGMIACRNIESHELIVSSAFSDKKYLVQIPEVYRNNIGVQFNVELEYKPFINSLDSTQIESQN
jgi:hypothetical protein